MGAVTLAIVLLIVAPPMGARDSAAAGDVLAERWLDLWSRLEVRGAHGDHQAVYRRLVDEYSEPPRAYHSLSHVESVLAELDAVRDLAEDPEAVEFALWFHDVVYDTHARDNEEKSAQRASTAALALGLGADWAARVSELVLATRHNSVPADGDAQLLVDLDLSILGQPRERFDAYERAIVEEYSWVIAERGATAFYSGRARILQRFLDRPEIYSTELLRRKYEGAARANLKYSLQAIEEKLGETER